MDDNPEFGSINFEFPDSLDKSECQESTFRFAFSRLNENPNFREEWCDPILTKFARMYPLPIGEISIGLSLRSFQNKGRIPPTLISRSKAAYAGLAKQFVNGETRGWFIGVVQDNNFLLSAKIIIKQGRTEQWKYLANTKQFKFVEGIIILEGKLDEKVIGDLRAYEKEYNKNILGKRII